MSTPNQSCQLKVSVKLEVDSRLIRLADRLDLSLAGILEEALLSRLPTSGQVHSVSVSDVNLSSVYKNLIDEYPANPIGLRHCFRDK